ncbi:MAG TPA: nucleotidyltransferase family protein [Anaerolineales bacterium]|nr:nucleotidyltransferase family protein [Anaerolineales bacterium]
MDAIVTAGGRPEPGDLLFPYTQGAPKALVDVAGKPMIQWVLDALCLAQSVDRIVIIGLQPDSGLSCSKPVAYIPDQGNMLDNIRSGVMKVLALNPQAEHVLAVSSDIPAVTAEAVDWVIHTAMQTDDDIYYNVIPRSVMEARFPDSRRSYTRLKDAEVCGGDMNVIRCSLATDRAQIWEDLIGSRKNVFKQAALIGYGTLVLLVFRAVGIDDAVKRVTKSLKLKGRAIVCPYAEVGMDVDKPNQLELLRADLTASSPVSV